MQQVDLRDPRITRGVSKELMPVLRTAEQLGWTGKRNSNGSLRLMSPVDDHAIHLPMGRQDPTLPKKLASRVLAHSDQERVGELARVGSGKAKAAMLTRGGEVTAQEFEDITALADVLESTQGAAFGLMPAQAIVVSETPWLAKLNQTKAGGAHYESDSVIERHWSDGTVDYLCPTCRALGQDVYTADNPRSVATHNRRHVIRGEKTRATTPGKKEIVEVRPDDEVTPRTEARIERLAKELAAALVVTRGYNPSDTSAEDYARRLAAHIIEQRGERQEHEPIPVEPLTPEGLVAQIRALVARDLLAERQAMLAQVEQQALQIAAVEASLERERRETARHRATLSAFAEMAREVADEGRESDVGSGDRESGTPATGEG